MGFATDMLSIIQAAIRARADGGLVDSYTLPDGTDVRMCPFEKLLEKEKEFSGQAAAELGGTVFRRSRFGRLG